MLRLTSENELEISRLLLESIAIAAVAGHGDCSAAPDDSRTAASSATRLHHGIAVGRIDPNGLAHEADHFSQRPVPQQLRCCHLEAKTRKSLDLG